MRMVIEDLDSIIPGGDDGLPDLSCNRCNKRFSDYRTGFECFQVSLPKPNGPWCECICQSYMEIRERREMFPDISHPKLKNTENIGFPIGESYRIIFSISAKGGTFVDYVTKMGKNQENVTICEI